MKLAATGDSSTPLRGTAMGAMVTGASQPSKLRILIADERQDRLAQVADAISSLGHTVVAAATDTGMVAALSSHELPDVAIVCLDESSEHALHLIRQIVRESACPVIALLDVEDPDFINQAAQIGIFAYIVDGDTDRLQSSFGVALRRFAEYHGLEGAFDRRAVTERAKGILMERHQIDEHAAFELLRNHSRQTNQKLIDIAHAVTDTHALLPPRSPGEPRHPAGDRRRERSVLEEAEGP